ncbi:MAG: hypothetical protein JRF21_11440 [Deltaproteobacteria bacterium]|nr:hypothetical protein [Deltaproteobacteria bacterium]
MTEKSSHLWVKDITESDNISSCYLVKGKKTGTTRKAGRPNRRGRSQDMGRR